MRQILKASLLVGSTAVLTALILFALLRVSGSASDTTPAATPAVEPAPAPEPAPLPAEAPSPAQPADGAFWRLIDDARSSAGNDTSQVSELLRERLEQLSPRAIIEFAQTRSRLDRRAYTWDLWGAAYVIEDGCSDDCFRDFRAYVISLGRDTYERALRDPDSLASVVQDAETGDWENADHVAPDAYSSMTGNDFPLDDSDVSGQPRGTPFDENSIESLMRRYPRLAARFRS